MPDSYILSGSTAEGQGYARRWASNLDKLQDLDLIKCMGEIESENELISIPHMPVFVLVKWNNKKLVHLPFSYYGVELDDDDFSPPIPLVNGFQMKRRLAEQLKQSPHFPGKKSVATDKAAVETQATHIDPADLDSGGRIFEKNLKFIEEQRRKPKDKKLMDKLFENFVYYCRQAAVKEQQRTDYSSMKVLPAPFSENFSSFTLPFNLNIAEYQLSSFLLLSPIFDCRLPTNYYNKCRFLLTFYEKYKVLGSKINTSFIPFVFSFMQKSTTVDMDYVPALKLNFWPTNMQPFLKRLKNHRALLYEKIKNTHMHLVPKWSRLTPLSNQVFEFRYSLSEIEVILAKNRNIGEKCLNGIARSIYYKYLYRSTELTSYTVKTTVLWMCETIDIDEKVSNNELAYKWIDFMCKHLKIGYCPHYFVENLNIWQHHERKDLDKALSILRSKIDLNDRTVPTNDYSRHCDVSLLNILDEDQSDPEESIKENLLSTFDEDYKEFQRQWYGRPIIAAECT
ncbi:unnamed protein product [Rotaria sp. Silwood2]|nr:unnamed protein product [Rotaria sp. Silwood2]CAF3057592.1 unnamed protein product [Rotaria sp. Silwood2]CAF3488864.1 unnamed protein product [Rotaria sp. Silwood2]CAF4311525.1 unnamed protein product [Rotaria sp. Silwood2]CAF4469656.1 unnamed protein product [Rotaria sp. Silwood2]